MIYLLLLIVCLLCWGISFKFTNPIVKYILFLLCFLCFLYISANRYMVGTDYGAYATSFNRYSSLPLSMVMSLPKEKGFFYLVYCIGLYSTDYAVLFSLTSFIILSLVFYFIKKESNNLFLSILLFLCFGIYFNSFNFIRQMIAGSIVCYAFLCLPKKELYKYCILVLFASLWHTSALIMIPFAILFYLPFHKYSIVIYTTLIAIVFVFSVPIFDLVTQLVYQQYDPITAIEMTQGLTIWFMVPYLIFGVAVYFKRKQLIDINPIHRFTIQAHFWIVMFYILALKHAILSRFIILLFIPVVCILFVDVCIIICKDIKLSNKKYVVFSLLIFLCFISIQMYWYMSINYNGCLPYQTISERYIYEKG